MQLCCWEQKAQLCQVGDATGVWAFFLLSLHFWTSTEADWDENFHVYWEPKDSEKGQIFHSRGKKKQCFKMFHRGRKKCFGNNLNVLVMNEIELVSPLCTASRWLLRSSERRHQLWDKSLETAGWVNWDLRLSGSVLQSLKLSFNEAMTPGLPDPCFCGRNLRRFLFHVARPCRNPTEHPVSITSAISCGSTITHQVSSQDILFRWQLWAICFFNSYTLEKHFSSQKWNFPVKMFCWKIPDHSDFCCLYWAC